MTVAQWSGTTFTLRFGGVLTGQNVAELDVVVTPATVAAELTQTTTGDTVDTPLIPAHDLVVDYAAQSLVIPTGGTPITLTMDGADGELTEAFGQIELTVSEFLTVAGEIAFRRADAQVHVLGETDPVAVSLLTIGGQHLNAFAGLNGGTPDAIGLTLSNVEFAVAYATQVIDAAPDRKWLSVKATAEEAGFVGSDVLNIIGSDLTVEITRPATDSSLLDLVNHPIEVRTGLGDDDKLALDLDSSSGAVTRVEGTVNIQVGNFFQTAGTFHIDKTQAELVESGPDPAAPAETVDLLLIGGTNVSAFVGLNGGTDDALGLAATNVNFGLMIATSQADPSKDWTALKADAGSVAFAGIDGLTMSASDVEIEINTASPGETVLDFSAAPLDIQTGGTPITLDFDGDRGELFRAQPTSTSTSLASSKSAERLNSTSPATRSRFPTASRSMWTC